MQWLVVVLFVTLQGDMYIFTTPNLKTQMSVWLQF